MKYTKEERLEIGRRIYDGELTCYRAAEEYSLSFYTAREYMRVYRDAKQLPAKHAHKISSGLTVLKLPSSPTEMKDYEAMSREELITALVMARINEARLKKGYEVKGAGAEKEYIPIGS